MSYNSITYYTESIQTIIDNKNVNCPLNIGLIPNTMGINLCSVDSISWSRIAILDQLVNITINFKPILREEDK